MSTDDDGRNSFVRGMTIGAIIGAIVAGSSLWSRRRRGRHQEDGEPELVASLAESPIDTPELPKRSEEKADNA